MVFRSGREYELLDPWIDLELENPSSICPVSKESFRYSMRGLEEVLLCSPPHNSWVKKSFGFAS